MTLEQCKKLNLGLGCKCVSSLPVVEMPSFVPPVDPEIADQIKTAEPAKSYNALSIADVKTLSKFKYSDDLHRPDLINAVYQRANRLQEFGATVGAGDFIKSYTH